MQKQIGYTPLDGKVYPRFSGVKTFFRLPLLQDEKQLDEIDVALLGAPFDGGVSFRPGARFGPEAIRSISSLGRGYNPASQVHIFKKLKVADVGDVAVVPQSIEQTHKAIAGQVGNLLKHDCLPIVVGGDHSTTIGSMQAIFEKYGQFNVIHFDAHTDTYPQAWGCDVHHGTFMRLGHERGWFKKDGVVQIGLRGPFSSEDDLKTPKNFGYQVFTVDDVRSLGLAKIKQTLSSLSDSPTYVTFDVDCLDPSCAPGTGTPVPGGLTSWEAMQLLRAINGKNIVAADVVEMCPPYDVSDLTSLVALSVIFELLSGIASR
ncbi:agmatinase [Sulfobacillus acidophilus]|uniref:Agmatinase n=1 Tax=Sulfobacillus acidophilus TaxID=53633 RepID=A0ABS3AYZ6_9FIRM|nr:agmatinase [Sulfobacillus acidophilus]